MLSGDDLRNANLVNANLSGAILLGANLRNANLSGANLSDLSDAIGVDLVRVTSLGSADLTGAKLSEANLFHASLGSANLFHASLGNADLTGANLGSADLTGANLGNAKLSGANLSNAKLSGASLFHANLRGANLSDANLSGANLSHADLNFCARFDANAIGLGVRQPTEAARGSHHPKALPGDGDQFKAACAGDKLSHTRGAFRRARTSPVVQHDTEHGGRARNQDPHSRIAAVAPGRTLKMVIEQELSAV